MPLPPPLPRTLLAELGKVVVIWAYIEQDLILHASAMAAQDTDGKPIEYLRMDFKRLREKWFSLCRKSFDDDIMKVVNKLNVALCRLAPERGYYVHGMWRHAGQGKYELRIFEQKTALQSLRGVLTLAEIRTYVAACYKTSLGVHGFTTGKNHCFKNKRGTVAKVPATLVPRDEG